MKFMLWPPLCFLLLACQGMKDRQADSLTDSQALGFVQSIYIEDLGHEDGENLTEKSALVRELISASLAKSGRFSVVQNPHQADAVLTGLVGVEPWYHGMEGYYGMEGDLDDHAVGVGKLRLLDSKTKQTIWTHAYQAGFLKPDQSVAERVAEQMVEQLVRDALHNEGVQPNIDK